LDQSLVYVTSDTAWGKLHLKDEWPVLMIGKAAGRLRGDEHHNFQGESVSRALFTAAKIMGSDINDLGLDAGQTNSILAGIQA
jgi:hypothetical protein